jgi:carbonic anhydrase
MPKINAIGILSVGAAILFAGGCATRAPSVGSHESTAEHKHWSYEGETGPAYWGTLQPDYGLCSTGMNQSPIDIVAPVVEDIPDIQFDYQMSSVVITNNGHTVQVNLPPGHSIDLDGRTYHLVQFHFHAPSEHTVRGKHAAAEMHLVHQASDGRLAVVGMLIEEGAEHAGLAPLWNLLPREKGTAVTPDLVVSLSDLLPKDRRTIRYDGSLTTPPGTEGVRWSLMVEPVTLSPTQLEVLTGICKNNNRPVQSLHGRAVVEDSVAR